MTFLIAAAAFANSLGLNWFYAKSVLAVAQRNRVAAANWTALICACGFMATYVVIAKSGLGIVAALAGAWIGTFVSVEKPGDVAMSTHLREDRRQVSQTENQECS